MGNRLTQSALLGGLVLGLALGGCGGSSTHATTTPPAPATAPTATAAGTSTTPARSTHSKKKAPARTPSSTIIASRTVATAPSTVATAPAPTPTGTPAAPPGLRPTGGYATYELCASGCSGAVPASLRRPLRLPRTGCPASAGGGPVKPAPGSGPLTLMPFIGSAWKGARVTWESAGSYTGPVLIRGRQVGGSGAVGFGEGHDPYDELQLLASGTGAPPPPGGGRAWLSFTRVTGPGCYAYQVDGSSFSSVIVFRAS